MRIPTLYLKWKAFKAFVNDPSSDKQLAEQILFSVSKKDRGKDADLAAKAAITFAKRLSGEVALEDETAEEFVRHMNDQIGSLRKRKQDTAAAQPPLTVADLKAPTLTFAARLVEQWPTVDDATLDRTNRALLDGLRVPVTEDRSQLVVDRYDGERSFGSDAAASGGAGPIIFQAGKHKGQIAILGESRVPLAAFTMFTRDPTPAGKNLWDLAWGEAVLWLPAPSVPIADHGRLLLMAKPEPVHPTPGNFTVSTALVWTPEALELLDPKTKSYRPDEQETAAYLTKLRSLHKYRRNKWAGAVTILSADYIVKA